MKRTALWLSIAATALLVATPAHAGRSLRFGTVIPEGSAYYKDVQAMADEVARLSGGELTIKWIWGGALGDDAQMADLIKAGKLDGGGLTDVGVSALVKDVALWSFPGLFEDYAEVDYIERQFRDRFDRLFADNGIAMIMFTDVGFIHVFSTRPIRSLDELRRETMWLWTGDTPTIYAAKLFGIPSIDTSLGELPAQLADGTVTTFQYPPAAAIAFGLQRYPRYISELRVRLMVGAIVLRQDVLDELPAHQQKLLRVVGRKWETRTTKTWRAESKKAIDAMVRDGIKRSRFSEAARQEYFQTALQLQPRYAEHLGVSDLMTEVVGALRKFRAARTVR